MNTQAISIKKRKISSQLMLGFALFSMFFGAGNLIFPLLIGKSVGGMSWYAIAGLLLTAVITPFLGLATMVLFRGDYDQFFSRIGKIPGFGLLLLLQLILGPFGVIPRLVTLMHAMLKPYFFEASPLVFGLFIGSIILVCSYNRQRLISFLGGLTPFLLFGLTLLIFLGIANGAAFAPDAPSAKESFLAGLMGGYNMMDLIAAFMFATVILPHFKQELAIENPEESRSQVLKKMAIPIGIGASLLFLTYTGLCFVSAYHGWTLNASLPPEQLLSVIATRILGPIGGLIAALTVVLACLTTAITLTAIFAEYLRKDICQEKISTSNALLITLGITVCISSLGFGSIAALLGPILEIVYPGLILFTVLNLLHILYGWRHVKWPVLTTFAASALMYWF
jgi:LIVCS family branched-chain amino acid:cation transporter